MPLSGGSELVRAMDEQRAAREWSTSCQEGRHAVAIPIGMSCLGHRFGVKGRRYEQYTVRLGDCLCPCHKEAAK